MKTIAVILLVVGLGLAGTGVYLSYFIEEQTTCGRYLSIAQTKSVRAKAAVGTPQETSLKEEASTAIAGAESVCGYARQSKQNGLLMMIGGLLSTIASIALLLFLRRANK